MHILVSGVVIFLGNFALAKQLTAHHANVLLRLNPALKCQTGFQCIEGTCLNLGVLHSGSKVIDEMCICKRGFIGDHCEFSQSVGSQNGIQQASIGIGGNFNSLIWSITVMFVMISIIFLFGGYNL